MKKLRLIGVLALVVFLGACSSGSDEGSLTPSDEPATASPAATASAAASGETVKVSDSKVLTDAAGKSLYTFDNDSAGKSNCADTCAQTWPPLTFSGSGKPTGAENLDVITRDDGAKQVTWNGKPLYTYSGDTKAGDTNGDGIGGKWHLAKAS
jgi:predicted lipoprotein with Yx(FWY)xxD motif